MDSAKTYAEQARSLSRTLRFYDGEAQSLNLLGTIDKESKKFPQAIVYYEAAIRLYAYHHSVKRLANGYVLLAQAWREKGDSQRAKRNAQTAVDIFIKNGLLVQAAEASLELGNCYLNDGDELIQKTKFYRQALKLFAQDGRKRRQADVLKDLGDLYIYRESIRKRRLTSQSTSSLSVYQLSQHTGRLRPPGLFVVGDR